MAFAVRWITLSVLTYEISAGDLHGRQLDSYQVSNLPAPLDSYRFPTQNFVAPPPVDYNTLPDNYYGNRGQSHSSPIRDHLTPPETYGIPSRGPSSSSFDHPVNYQGHTFSGSYSSLVGSSNSYSRGFGNSDLINSNFQVGDSINSNVQGGNSINSNFPRSNLQGPPRFVGETVRVGKPFVSSSRVVYKDVVKRVPVEVTRHIEVDVPQPVPVPVRQEIRVPVPEAYPVVSGEVVNSIPYTVFKTQSYEVERPVPYEVVREVPYPVIKRVKVDIDKPYTVWKKVRVPVKKHVEVPVTVWKPYPVQVIKHVTHYKSENCCW